MAAQLSNEEKKVYRQIIKEQLAKDKNVSSLRIVWELRHQCNRKRHHQTIQWGFVKRMRKIIEEVSK